MLTHDIEPVIDIVKSTSALFQGSRPSATFLSSRKGVVKETAIERDDVRTFASICAEMMSSDRDDIIRCIYLRRHCELLNDTGVAYNLLASLFKKREVPTMKFGEATREMTDQERQEAQNFIKREIPDFCYNTLLAELCDDEVMKEKFFASDVGYEKVQIFRILKAKHEDSVIMKFINESYHIENEYIMQLNPHVFESIPEYIVDGCESLI